MSAEGYSNNECNVGDNVFLTEAGVRKLLVQGFAPNEFSSETPLEIQEIRGHSPNEMAYVVKIPEADGAIVELERNEFEL